jgi:hypothetical protein
MWIAHLYGVRRIFVRLLGMHQGGIGRSPRLRPEILPMAPGERASYLTVRAAEDEQCWLSAGWCEQAKEMKQRDTLSRSSGVLGA